MGLPRRRFFNLLGGAAALPALSGTTSATDYPTRPVHLIAGFPPGGIVDIIARLIGQWLSERLGQQFVIENRAGAGSNIATEFVVKAPPDGYTLLLVSSVNAWNTAIYDNLKFNFVSDIAPIAGIIRTPGVMEVTPSLPTTTVPEFIAYAKANPGKIIMATGGPGSGQHVYGELFKVMAGVDLVTVHYRGAGPALPELMSGRAQIMFDPVASSIAYITAGKLRPLGVTTATRIEVLPDIPPIGDFVPGFEASGWDGIGAPAQTAPDRIAILNTEVNAALADPTFRSRLDDLGTEPLAGSPAEFGKFISAYIEKWGPVIRSARNSQAGNCDVRFGSITDILGGLCDVRFTPKSERRSVRWQYPLCAKKSALQQNNSTRSPCRRVAEDPEGSAAKLLTKDEARRIVANIAKLPEAEAARGNYARQATAGRVFLSLFQHPRLTPAR